MSQFLLEVFIEKHRILALQKLAFASVNSNLSTQKMSNLLGFDSLDTFILFLTNLGK